LLAAVSGSVKAADPVAQPVVAAESLGLSTMIWNRCPRSMEYAAVKGEQEMTQGKRLLLEDEQLESIERRELARWRHQQALLAVNRQCLPHGSGLVSDESLIELDDATTELRAARWRQITIS
jgi:hypothetical protein